MPYMQISTKSDTVLAALSMERRLNAGPGLDRSLRRFNSQQSGTPNPSVHYDPEAGGPGPGTHYVSAGKAKQSIRWSFGVPCVGFPRTVSKRSGAGR